MTEANGSPQEDADSSREGEPLSQLERFLGSLHKGGGESDQLAVPLEQAFIRCFAYAMRELEDVQRGFDDITAAVDAIGSQLEEEGGALTAALQDLTEELKKSRVVLDA